LRKLFLNKMVKKKIQIPENIKEKMQKLIDNKFEVYVVGGAVRDSILGEEPHDWDLFTNATGEDILKIFPNGKVLGGEERQEKILTVIVDGVEISQFRSNGKRTEVGNDLTTHQSTCDFTCNSIACDIEGNIIDHNNGQFDIHKRNLNFVGNPQDRIKEDPLRILRGYRFWCTFGHWGSHSNIDLTVLDTLPKERIREEFIKIIQNKNGIENLHNDGYGPLTKNILPEFKKVIDMNGGDNHNETVDKHMLSAFKIACEITDDWRIRLATFLHDIGKGECRSYAAGCKNPEEEMSTTGCGGKDFVCGYNDNERCPFSIIHFYQHDKVGAEIVKNWMNEYKFSKDDIKFISTLVRYHMWSYKCDEISKKAYIRMFEKFREAGVSIYDFMMIIYCDHQANMKKPRMKFGDFCKDSWILKRYWECIYTKEPFNKNQLELQGGEIMKLLDKPPGKWIGDLMDEMFNAVMNDEVVNDRLELVKWVKKWMKKKKLNKDVKSLENILINYIRLKNIVKNYKNIIL